MVGMVSAGRLAGSCEALAEGIEIGLSAGVDIGGEDAGEFSPLGFRRKSTVVLALVLNAEVTAWAIALQSELPAFPWRPPAAASSS